MPIGIARDTTYGTCQALSTCKAQPCRHSIGHVTHIVTETMDVNNRHRGGSNYRCQACTFRIKRFHIGSCVMGVSLFTDQFLSGKGQRISTWVTTTDTRDNEPYFPSFLFSESFQYCIQIQICPNRYPRVSGGRSPNDYNSNRQHWKTVWTKTNLLA